jgi:hypothetical protein
MYCVQKYEYEGVFKIEHFVELFEDGSEEHTIIKQEWNPETEERDVHQTLTFSGSDDTIQEEAEKLFNTLLIPFLET